MSVTNLQYFALSVGHRGVMYTQG